MKMIRRRVLKLCQVNLPALLLIRLCTLYRVFACIDASASYNGVRASLDSLAWSLLLLTKFIALLALIDACSENNQELLRTARYLSFVMRQRLHSNESNNGATVELCQFDRLLRIEACCQTPLRGHVGKDDECPLILVQETGLGDNLRQGLGNAFTPQNAHVDNVSEFRDSERTAMILLLERIPDVDEFAIFEDHEIVLRR